MTQGVGLDLHVSKQKHLTDSSKQGNEPPCSINDVKFFDELRDQQLQKELWPTPTVTDI
jgi:hypothetical protein